MPKSDKLIEEDPFLLLGFGVNSYFDVMLALMKMNILITIFVLPLFYCYSHNPQMAMLGDSPVKYDINKYTLGNLGGSHVKCQPHSSVF